MSEAAELKQGAVRLETTPTGKYPEYRVRAKRPKGIEPDKQFRIQHSRRCSCVGLCAPVEEWAEYEFYYHPEMNLIFGVCPVCDKIHITPIWKERSRRLSEDRTYRGSKARTSWRTYRGASAVVRL